MAIGSFLESYDLTGKTVIPFCTSQDNDISVSMDYIRLEKITYDTWESFTYAQKSQKLTKEAWCTFHMDMMKNEKYNVFYLSHGGWSNETTLMGTDKDPHSFKNVIDHAISDILCL